MTALESAPAHWTRTTIGEIADVSGGIQKQPSRKPRENTAPFLRVANVQHGDLDLDDIHRVELFDGELERYRLAPGDLLVVEGNGSLSHIGRSALWKGAIADCVHQNHLIRVRPGGEVLPRYLNWYWNSPLARPLIESQAKTTSGLYTLSTAKVKGIRVVIPPTREEQQSIVDTLERYLSWTDAASSDLRTADVRVRQLQDAVLQRFLQVARTQGEARTLPDVWLSARYGTSERCTVDGQGTPVLRIPNIRRRKVDFTDIKRAAGEADVDKAQILPGDLLVIRTNGSRNLIGRVAVVPKLTADHACASYLIRLRLDPKQVRPDFVAAALEAPTVRAQLEHMAASSAGQFNLSVAKLRRLQIPVPPLERQDQLLERLAATELLVERSHHTVGTVQHRARQLRETILVAAFTGQLHDRDHGAPSVTVGPQENVA